MPAAGGQLWWWAPALPCATSVHSAFLTDLRNQCCFCHRHAQQRRRPSQYQSARATHTASPTKPAGPRYEKTKLSPFSQAVVNCGDTTLAESSHAQRSLTCAQCEHAGFVFAGSSHPASHSWQASPLSQQTRARRRGPARRTDATAVPGCGATCCGPCQRRLSEALARRLTRL